MGAPQVNPEVKQAIRKNFNGNYILSGGYHDAPQSEHDLQAKKGELVAFGRPFIGNPDLVERLKTGKNCKMLTQQNSTRLGLTVTRLILKRSS